MDMIHAQSKDWYLVAKLMKAIIFHSLKHYEHNEADATSDLLLSYLEKEVT